MNSGLPSPFPGLESIHFQIDRLAERLRPLQERSSRIAILRLLIVSFGILAAVVLTVLGNGSAARLVLGTTFLVYVGVALFHHRLETWIETLSQLRGMKMDQRARLELDWDNLPPPRPLQLSPQNKALAFDLDLTGYRSLHQLLDTTISRHGTQLLGEWLTQARPDVVALAARQAIVRELKPRARFRERFWLTYRRVLKRELEGDNLLLWLQTDFPSARLRWTLPVATVLVLVNLILFILWQFFRFPPFFIASLIAYAAFYYWNQEMLERVLTAVVRVNTELEKFRAIVEYIERASFAGAPQLRALCSPFLETEPGTAAPSQELRRVQMITVAVGLRNNPLSAVLLNIVLPWDFLFAFLANRERKRVAQTLPEWVRVVHELDALIALANFAAQNPGAAFPEIRAGASPVLRAKKLGHPLIPTSARVSNDFEIQTPGQVELLTGSNMAGKSTFLKTVGVNLCLAYAGAPVVAAEFAAQPFRLHTCIRITDSIVDGFSYFYAEVKCLKALLGALRAGDELPLLYLVDEIFRGTNNRERLIGSRAFIQTLLGAHGAGLIATHDLELAHLADENADAHNYHFRDEVRDGRLVFDYILRAGPSPTTNALKIMELEGLPVPKQDPQGF